MPKRVHKTRAPRPVRRTGTEIIEDRRTRRARSRGDELRRALEEEDRAIVDAIRENYDRR